jgi:hypothetical protein
MMNGGFSRASSFRPPAVRLMSSVRNGQIESKKQSVLDLNECLMIVFGVSYSF